MNTYFDEVTYFPEYEVALPNPGEMNHEHFILLIRISGIHSEKVIYALEDFLVRGLSRSESCYRRGASLSYFSISLRRIRTINNSVYKISKYYLTAKGNCNRCKGLQP